MKQVSPTVHIITPVHNRKPVTATFARCLKAQNYTKFVFHLVDDGSTDGTAEAVKEIIPDVVVIQGDGNLWWGGALQAGYESVLRSSPAEDDIVLLINDDVFFAQDYLQNAVELLAENSGCAICSQYFDQESGVLLDRGASCQFSENRIAPAGNDLELEFLSTRGLFLKFSDFKHSGGFLPQRLPHYLSDYEFTHRLKVKLNLKLMTSAQVPLFGNSVQSGVGHVANLNFYKALKLIFSKRYHSNPIYVSEFIRLCYPPEFQRRFIFDVWMDELKKWIKTFPFPIPQVIYRLMWPLAKTVVSIGRDLFAIRRAKSSVFKSSSVQEPKNYFYRFLLFKDKLKLAEFLKSFPDLNPKVGARLPSSQREAKWDSFRNSFELKFIREKFLHSVEKGPGHMLAREVLADYNKDADCCIVLDNQDMEPSWIEDYLIDHVGDKVKFIGFRGFYFLGNGRAIALNPTINNGASHLTTYPAAKKVLEEMGFAEVFYQTDDASTVCFIDDRAIKTFAIFRRF